MRRLIAPALVAGAAVCIELILPGEAAYHSGWYNVALAALVIVTVASARGVSRRAKTPHSQWAAVAL
ncbi:MAG: hypothetical protein WA668_07545, partial [Candidatus Cybelea sp.]